MHSLLSPHVHISGAFAVFDTNKPMKYKEKKMFIYGAFTRYIWVNGWWVLWVTLPQKLCSLKRYITILAHHGAIYLCKSGYLSAEAKAAIVSEQGGGGGRGVIRLSADWRARMGWTWNICQNWMVCFWANVTTLIMCKCTYRWYQHW